MITDIQACYFAHELTRLRAADGVGRLAQSLFDAHVDLNPHQIDAALFALRSPAAKGVLLADEVGLGKTIEAGVLLCQFWAERRRRLLVVCPASLRKQWASELEEKFGLPTRVMDARSHARAQQATNADPLGHADAVIIVSYNFAAKIHESLYRIPWDLAVIDEAHKLRNVYKSGNVIGQRIRQALTMRRKVLLTATPLQNSLIELYGLSTLIDEHLFGDAASFRSQFMGKDSDLEILRGRLMSFCKRTLRSEVQEYIRFTDRQALTIPFMPSDAEQTLYESVSRFLLRETSFAVPAAQRQLTTLVLYKLLASSSRAIASTLDTLRERLRARRPSDQDLLDVLADSEDIDPDYLDQTPDPPDEDSPSGTAAPDGRQLEAEIMVLDELASLARSIDRDSKADALLKALEIGFRQMAKLGAKRKALIFTESRRTQEFLRAILSEAGFSGRVVMFNGNNADPESQALLSDWMRRNRETGRVTGSHPVDMRMALVEAFRDEAEIMIATEAAAEGVNLQFCSLVINYDLPWNPQRIEQRIGRCHRYGQQHDVVVINFLNQRNAADRRVLELLEEKFKLFKGVFGASDEVLGSIESGIDFEKRILRIHQECRTEAEIDSAFAKLRAEMDEAIRARVSDTRLNLLAHFDEDVHNRLRLSLDDARIHLDRTARLFWKLTRHMLVGRAEFEDSRTVFRLADSPVPEARPGSYHLMTRDQGAEASGIPFRLNHPLGAWILEQGRALPVTDGAKVTFHLSDHPARISVLEPLMRRKGWLSLHKLTLDSFEREEFLVFGAIDDKQRPLDQEMCEKLLLCDATWSGQAPPMHEVIRHIFEETERKALDTVAEEAAARNRRHFDEQRSRLEAWADDKLHAAEKELADVKNQVKALTRQARQTTAPTEQMEIQNRIQELERSKRRLRQRIFDVEDEIIAERDRLIAALEVQIRRQVTEERLFTIQWEIR
ncbi:SNF2-related protein [Skermanella pratensis]|uniref:SNF2-related protein n=1 Tax=Skermanella pratensis TaxID=2233999 RepID=UPI001301061C|nr:SNF2-related protein [Skermanella pratensis]